MEIWEKKRKEYFSLKIKINGQLKKGMSYFGQSSVRIHQLVSSQGRSKYFLYFVTLSETNNVHIFIIINKNLSIA